MNKFKLRNGITFLSVPNLDNRKFNKFRIYLFIKRTSRNMILAKMLSRILDFDPIEYNESVNDILRDMYNASLDIDCEACEDKIYIKLSISVLNDKYAFEPDENLCIRALEILCDTLLKVDIEDRTMYYQVLAEIEDEIECDYKDKENYLKRALHEFFPDSFAAVNVVNSIREVDDISYNILAKFYKDVLRTAEIFVFGYGCYEEGIVKQYLVERFKEIPSRRFVRFESDFDFKSIGIKEISKFTPEGIPSNLTVLYWLGNKEEIENYNAIAYVYTSLLHEVIFNLLREEKGLVYGISVSPYIHYSCLGIYGNINAKNYKDIIACIESPKLISLDVYDDNVLKEKAEQVKKDLKLVLDECCNGYDFGYICYIYQDNLCKEDIDKVTVEDIRKFARMVAENIWNFHGIYMEKKS